jgi:hypothetical protein
LNSVLFIFSTYYSDLQNQRLDQLRMEFGAQKEMLIEEFDTERGMLVEQHSEEMLELYDIMFAMEQNFNERESEAKSDFQSMRDEIKNKVKIQ